MDRTTMGSSPYRPLKKIGEGSFGNVWKAVNIHTGQVVAVKILKDMDGFYDMKNNPEINALRLLKGHPNIIKLEQDFVHCGSLCLAFEYMNSSLLDVIKDRRTSGIPFSESEIRHVCSQLLKGLDYMHSRNVMHRDLKPANILVSGDHNNYVKIADLGSAASLSPSTAEYTDYVTTRWYRSPEQLLGDVHYGSKVDMWAVGAIMAEMYLLKPLLPGNNKSDQLQHICRVIETPLSPFLSLSDSIPAAGDSAMQLMESLLSWDPAMRPTAREALKHAFFSSKPRPSTSSSYSSYWSSPCAQFTAPLPPILQAFQV
ncbi:cyclin-dependent kinase [Ranunculus cassubicifolius]